MPDSRLEHELGPEDKVFFLHIPKTGGTTLHGYLQCRFHADAVFLPFRFDRRRLPAVADFDKYKLFRGHFPYDVMRQLLDRAPVCFTLLRQPVDRFVSNHTYWQQEHHAHVRMIPANELEEYLRLSLDEFVEASHLSTLAELSNMQSRLFSERYQVERVDDGLRAKLTEPPDVERAKAVLDTFAVVGLTERFDESLCLLAFVFGWPPPARLPPLNVTRRRPRLEQLAPETRQRIEAANALDLALYPYAMQLFEQRLAEVTECLLERYGTRADAALPRPLPLDSLVRLLEHHYERRYAQRRPPPLVQARLRAADPVLSHNWHVVETNPRHGPFRWTGPGTRSTFDLPLAAEHDLQIRIRVLQAIAPEVLQGASLTVNEAVVPLRAEPGPDGVRLLVGRIPRAALQTRRPFSRLALEVPQTFQPRDRNPASRDKRPLGLAISWIELAPAGVLE